MGISSSSSKTTPVYDKQVLGAADTLTGAYNTQAPKIAAVSDQVTGMLPGLMSRFQNGDPALNATRDYITSTLSGNPQHNPYLDQMIGQTNNDVANTTAAHLGTRGLTGGTVMQDILSRNLAQNETGLRYTDYANAQQQRAQAAGMGAGASAAQSGLISPVLDAAQAAMLPMQAASGYAGGINGLLGQYTNNRTSNPWGPSLLQGIGTIGAGFAMSDVNAKTDITRIGQTDAGLPLYSFRYHGDPTFRIGPMAQEVEVMQPHAMGPDVGGFKTVYYGEVR